jgi:hypothetical protein
VGADADVLGDAVPGESGMIVGIQQVVLLERGPIVRVHRDIDNLHGAIIQERNGLDLREGGGARGHQDAGRKH